MVKLSPLRFLAQFILYALFAVVVGYFSISPAYQYLAPGKAQLKLSFRHAGQHKVECRRLTPEELAELPPNMRNPFDCPRERVALVVELLLDGELLFHDSLNPSGLARDGSSAVYRRFIVDSGRHHLQARLRDSRREQGFDHDHAAEIELMPGQNFVIDFHVETGGFAFL
ncbi:MAG: hypothetical protein GY807_07680 [Gammaproteobacteria bacterium]|nr:hypothetical protein [Gammaproteobacteria bacterium]